jgi:hypothetical protein
MGEREKEKKREPLPKEWLSIIFNPQVECAIDGL